MGLAVMVDRYFDLSGVPCRNVQTMPAGHRFCDLAFGRQLEAHPRA